MTYETLHIAETQEPYENLHICLPNGSDIAKVFIDDAPVPDYNRRQEAYARLFVQAPELLELVKELIQFHPLYSGEVKSHSHLLSFDRATKLLKQLGA